MLLSEGRGLGIMGIPLKVVETMIIINYKIGNSSAE